MPSSSLTFLPPEILTECLLYLDAISVTRCQLLCKAFHNIVATSIALKYKLELEFDSLVDPCTLSQFVSDRYQHLIARRRSWANLEWNMFRSIPSPGECSAYEVVAGKFAKTLWGKEFTILNLPTVNSEPSLDLKDDLEGMVKDFAMDPSQDILAYLEDDATPPSHVTSRVLSMHLRTLSSNRPHPEARLPVLRTSVPPDELWANVLGIVSIQLMDDTLALFVRNPLTVSRLAIWNWKSGEILVDQQTFDINHAFNFGFIDCRTYILTSMSGTGSIDIMHLRDGKLKLIGMLRLPELKRGVKIDYISTHSSALPQNPTTLGPNQNRRIHTFAVLYSPEQVALEEQISTHCLYVHNDTLLKFAEQGAIRNETFYFTWDKWGPANTRYQKIPGQYMWMKYVCGQRVVLPAIPGDKNVHIYDFNVHLSRLEPNSKVRRAVLHDTVLEASAIFKKDVRTSLPYYSMVRPVMHQYAGYMIDDQRVIGLKTTEGPEGAELEHIDVYCISQN